MAAEPRRLRVIDVLRRGRRIVPMYLLPHLLGVSLRGVLDVELPRVVVDRVVRRRLGAAAICVDAADRLLVHGAVALDLAGGWSIRVYLRKFRRYGPQSVGHPITHAALPGDLPIRPARPLRIVQQRE